MVSSSFSSSSDYIKNFSGRGKNTRVLMSETRLNATRTVLMGSFVKNVKKDDFIFTFLSKLGCCSQEYKSRKIHRNLVNPEVIIVPTKTGRTQIFIAKFPLYPRCQIVFLGATEFSTEATEVSHEVKSQVSFSRTSAVGTLLTARERENLWRPLRYPLYPRVVVAADVYAQ